MKTLAYNSVIYLLYTFTCRIDSLVKQTIKTLQMKIIAYFGYYNLQYQYRLPFFGDTLGNKNLNVCALSEEI